MNIASRTITTNTAPADGRIVNAMSVDVEDYFQVQVFADRIAREDWPAQPSRVERNTDIILELFADAGVSATFFTLGWIAERNPALIRRIVAGGHELASHGYQHIRADRQTPAEFRADISRTKAILEDLGGVAVNGYRAATFSIGETNLWAFDVLAEAGYRYSSSIYPMRRELCGMPDAPRFSFAPEGLDESAGGGFVEHPISTVRLAGRRLPLGGGGHFRLLPYGYFRWAINRVHRHDGRACIFYFHPWEIDPGQPRVRGVPLKSRLRHYTNLAGMRTRLTRLLGDFAWDRMDRVFPLPVVC